ncbi:MAG: DUF4340 domain-containing protein [Ruminococcaceae bacterium]|nr:DUF4340 domain-containing protein [Oscillospiraceae bacterium]
MKKKSTLIISACVCIIIFSLYFIISSLPTNEDTPDKEENAYLYIDQTHIHDVIGFSFAGGDFDLSFEKDGNDVWKYSVNTSLPVSSDFIETTLSQVELFLAAKEVARNLSETGLAEYGLDKPSYILTISLKKEDKTYIFGDYIESKGLYYASVKDSGVVYLVERAYVDAFSLDVEDFLTFDTFPDIDAENVKQINIICGNYSEEILPNSNSAEFISSLCDITLKEFVDFGSEKFGIYGLSESDAVCVYIKYSDSGGNIFTLPLKFGLGESEELNYLLVGNTLKNSGGNSYTYSEMVYLLSSSENDIIYRYISKAFSEK